jgi:hypothetical protein
MVLALAKPRRRGPSRPPLNSCLFRPPDQAAEIAQLRRECDRLRMERDILKNSRGPAIRLREEKQVVVGSTWRGAAVGFLVAFYPVKKRGPWAAAHLRVVTPPWRSRLGN